MQLVLKGIGVAGATPLGIAGDWSYLQEEEDRVFYFPHLSRLAARHTVGVLFVLCAWTALLLSHPSRSRSSCVWGGVVGEEGDECSSGGLSQAHHLEVPVGFCLLQRGASEEGDKPPARGPCCCPHQRGSWQT